VATLAELDATILAVAGDSKFSGLIGVDQASSSPLRRAIGLADRRWGVGFDTAMRASLASGTKGFTALAVMSLIESGVLQLDTTARSVLGDDLPEIDDAVTIEQLLAHRSGIGDYLDEDALGDINDHVMPIAVHRLACAEDYLEVLAGHPQVDPPGQRFVYNNGGFVVLALIAERVSGVAHDRLLIDRVCLPAGMHATSFLRADSLPNGVATGYLDAEGLRTNALHLPVIGCGDGGLFSTLDDMACFWRALFEGAIVPMRVVRSMTSVRSRSTERNGSYGLGFWLDHELPNVYLEGYDAGVSFRSLHDPDRGTTLTVISNWSNGAWPMLEALQLALGFE
jgi:CubicO group peptidase (beta-lactamase class C family)